MRGLLLTGSNTKYCGPVTFIMSKSPAQTNIEVFLAIRKKLEIIIRAEG